MSLFAILILGIIQGLTEFLPVSSSGHLVLVPLLAGWESQPLVIDTTLHLGTTLAIVLYFYKDIFVITRDFLSNPKSENGMLAQYIMVSSIPAAILGFLLEDLFDTIFRGMGWVIIFLAAGTLFIFVAEKYFSKGAGTLSYTKSFFIGLFQSLALFPGVSRSGASISAGMYIGLSRESAAKFSFLMAIPTIVGAGVYKMLSSYSILVTYPAELVLLGVLSSFIVGMLAIKFLLNFVKTNSLMVFVWYRLLLIVLLLALFI